MVARHWLYFGGFVVTGCLVVVTALIGVLDVLAILATGAPDGGGTLLVAMLGEAIEWLTIVFALGLFAMIFLVAAVVSILRNATLPQGDRLVSVVERIEHKYPLLREFDVSSKVER